MISVDSAAASNASQQIVMIAQWRRRMMPGARTTMSLAHADDWSVAASTPTATPARHAPILRLLADSGGAN
jgi:hypothetical protein